MILLVWIIEKKITFGEKAAFVLFTSGITILVFKLMKKDIWALFVTLHIVANLQVAARAPQILTNY